MARYDLAIIGGGVVGAAVAYQLSQYELSVVWLEKENDLGLGASRANTAIIHGGYDPEPGTMMARFNALGAERCFELCQELDVEFNKCGSLVIAFSPPEAKHLEDLFERGIKNGVRGMELISAPEVRRRQPNISAQLIGGLWIPHSGVINPWEFCLAMGEVAVRNGVDLRLSHEVIGVKAEDNTYRIETRGQSRPIESTYVINVAGVYSDIIHQMVAEKSFVIQPTRGEYYLLDSCCSDLVDTVIFQCPGPQGKGVLVAPTVHGNILVGPNSEVIDDREDTGVTRAGLDFVAALARKTIPSLDFSYSIRNYAGIRANSSSNDFVIDFARDRFLDLAAIRSPGLTCAPTIAAYALELLESAGLKLVTKRTWHGGRKVIRFKQLSPLDKAELIAGQPAYGRVICRCETVTEGEILAAIKREIKPVSVDGIKRRSGTGMGRCQGGFCGPRILEILARELGLSPDQINQDKDGSFILTGPTKSGFREV